MVRIASCSQASCNFLGHALFRTVFVNVGFLYTRQISHKLPAGLLVFITVNAQRRNFISFDLKHFLLSIPFLIEYKESPPSI
jgi:hypothetical protein